MAGIPLTNRKYLTTALGLSLLGLPLAIVGCSLDFSNPVDDLGDTVSLSVTGLLEVLFPDLSDEEIKEISVDLDYEDVLKLRDELEKARKAAVEFSEELFVDAEKRAQERQEDLADENDGYPKGLAAVGQSCLYNESSGLAEISLSGVFNGKSAVTLTESQVTVKVDGAEVSGDLSCLGSGQTVDIVFLIDITGSMANVIDSVTRSVVKFVDIIEESGVAGTVSVVTFQDSVGVNTTFQQPAPDGLSYSEFERSPFFMPVSISDPGQVEEARSFINRLEANQGQDAPENLAGAIDFARNNVIGSTSSGPNRIDGKDDPPYTEPFAELTSDRQVFIALTDITFHADDRDESNSSLRAPFVPRDTQEILSSLHETGTIVHVVDPSWADYKLSPGGPESQVDADYWALHTGGLGEDVVLGYSLVDLELVVVAEENGLLDVALDKIITSTCTFEFEAELSAESEVELVLDVEGEIFTEIVAVTSF